IEAVAAGKFHIYAVERIDQGIEILTGIAAGAPDAKGSYPPDSINGRVEARLAGFAEAARRFAQQGRDRGDEGPAAH
ncbi:MAG TPA: hypothetical protein VN980_02930, partial [Alphaproteobacteria bacterium]|nr:hypothetical protein [Alphaproteobacteria bacterium]